MEGVQLTESVGQRAARGARWITLGRIGVEGLAFGSSLVLARLLTPADFGQVAVAAIIYSFASGVPVNGLGGPIVRAEKPTRELVSTAQSMSLMVGLAATIGCLGLSRVLIGPFGQGTADLIAVLSVSFLFTSLSTVPQALMQREFDFRRLTGIEIASLALGTVVSISLAANGFGAISMILGMLTNAVTATLLSYAAAPVGRLGFSRSEARHIAGFGVPASGGVFVWMAARTVDYAILGVRFPAAAVGIYYRAYQLAAEYQGKFSLVFARVAFPAFSRAADRAELQRLRTRMVSVQASLVLPGLGLVAALAPTLIPWLYGPQWVEAVEPTQILCVAGACVALATGTDALALALGKPQAFLACNLVTFGLVGGSVWLASGGGDVTTVCWAVSAARVVSFGIEQFVIADRLAGVRLRHTLGTDVAPAAVATAGLLACSWPLQEWLAGEGWAAPAVLAVAGVVGVGAYVAVLRVVFPHRAREIAQLMLRLAPGLGRLRRGPVARG